MLETIRGPRPRVRFRSFGPSYFEFVSDFDIRISDLAARASSLKKTLRAAAFRLANRTGPFSSESEAPSRRAGGAPEV
jgi:hypothetical protein